MAFMTRKFIFKRIYSGKPVLKYDYAGRFNFKACDFFWKSIKLNINNVCNLKCTHCYRKPENNRGGIKNAYSLLDQLRRTKMNGRMRLDILGGEPLLSEDFMDVVSYAKTKARIENIQVFTNATLIDDAVAVKMRNSGVKIAVVPLHSHIEKVHDSITQVPGSWVKTANGIRSLLSAGIKTYSVIIFMSCNVDNLKELELFVKSLGAKTICFPYIRQNINDAKFINDKNKFQRAMNFYFQNTKHIEKVMRMVKFRGKACPAFVNSINIEVDGTVTPCPFVDLKLGNINQEKLSVILGKACFNNELIKFLSIPEECKQCSIVSVCGGGCKAFRYQTYHDAESKDINCSGPCRENVPLERLGGYIPYFF